MSKATISKINFGMLRKSNKSYLNSGIQKGFKSLSPDVSGVLLTFFVPDFKVLPLIVLLACCRFLVSANAVITAI